MRCGDREMQSIASAQAKFRLVGKARSMLEVFAQNRKFTNHTGFNQGIYLQRGSPVRRAYLIGANFD